MNIKLAYTREEAAELCGLGVESIRKAINTGALRAKRSAKSSEQGKGLGKYLITHQALVEWLDQLEDA